MPQYVLVPTAVYDHGVAGVFSSEELAREAAQEIWPTTDGHHRFRIDVLEQDKAYPDVFDHANDLWSGIDPMSLEELRRKRIFYPDVAEIEVNDLTKANDSA
jgi:hypothetical protein